MVTASKEAVRQLQERLVEKCSKKGVGFRMLVNTNESGEAILSIKFDLQHQGDEVIESDGIKIFLDPDSAAQISNYQLDYQYEPDGKFFLKQYEMPRVDRISAIELCQKLKSEVIARQDDGAIKNLWLRILDYFIAHNVPDDMFEGILEAQLNDPDSAKEHSKVICARILQAWRTA